MGDNSKTPKKAKELNTVYVLQHSYELNGCEETKLIGVYSTRKVAIEARRRLSEQSGFCDHKRKFSIDPYDLDVDHWTEGFVTVGYISE